MIRSAAVMPRRWRTFGEGLFRPVVAADGVMDIDLVTASTTGPRDLRGRLRSKRCGHGGMAELYEPHGPDAGFRRCVGAPRNVASCKLDMFGALPYHHDVLAVCA
jgi:hypothetical protein